MMSRSPSSSRDLFEEADLHSRDAEDIAAQILELQKRLEEKKKRKEESIIQAKNKRFDEQVNERRGAMRAALVESITDHEIRSLKQMLEKKASSLDGMTSLKRCVGAVGGSDADVEWFSVNLFAELYGNWSELKAFLQEVAQRVVDYSKESDDRVLKEYDEAKQGQLSASPASNVKVEPQQSTAITEVEVDTQMVDEEDISNEKPRRTSITEIEADTQMSDQEDVHEARSFNDILAQQCLTSLTSTTPMHNTTTPIVQPKSTAMSPPPLAERGDETDDGETSTERSSPIPLSKPTKSFKRPRDESQSRLSVASSSAASSAKKVKATRNTQDGLIDRFARKLTAGSNFDDVSEALHCSQCRQQAKSPHLSKCLHMYCDECWKSVRKQHSQNSLREQNKTICRTCAETVGRGALVSKVDMKRYQDILAKREPRDE